MATYGNKYYKELNSVANDGTGYTTLYVDQKDYTGTAMEIGDLQSLQMQIDGDDDPCEPIQKTIVTFTLVDSADKADTDTVKYGDWQEFYTPDSTKYRVRIVVDDELMWSGYVTPDSWEESLDYRGTVTITARDNIGHLDDFDFDYESEDGLASVQTLLQAALDKIDFAMDVTWLLATNDKYAVKALYPPEQDETVHLGTWKVNLSTFEGESWGTVFADLLSSLGLTFRFVGFNEYICTYLRYLPLLGHKTVLSNTVVALSGGTRTLDPAYRQIKDTLSYDYNEEIDAELTLGLSVTNYSTESYSVTGDDSGSRGGTITVTGSAPAGKNTLSPLRGWQASSGFYNAEALAYDAAFDGLESFNPKTMALLAANLTTAFTRRYIFGPIYAPVGTITLTFASNGYALTADGTTLRALPLHLNKIRVQIRYETVEGDYYYWDGSKWSTTVASALTTTYSWGDNVSEVAVAFGTLDQDKTLASYGTLSMAITTLDYYGSYYAIREYQESRCNGVYAGLCGITLASAETVDEQLKDDTVTTVNNADYNVKCDRAPEIGALSKDVNWITIDTYPNALYYEDIDTRIPKPLPYEVTWDQGATMPLPVAIHKQMLCYHHSTMQKLDGDFIIGQQDKWWPDYVLEYKGHYFLLQRGTYDFITCQMTGALLREFELYDDLWTD